MNIRTSIKDPILDGPLDSPSCGGIVYDKHYVSGELFGECIIIRHDASFRPYINVISWALCNNFIWLDFICTD